MWWKKSEVNTTAYLLLRGLVIDTRSDTVCSHYHAVEETNSTYWGKDFWECLRAGSVPT